MTLNSLSLAARVGLVCTAFAAASCGGDDPPASRGVGVVFTFDVPVDYSDPNGPTIQLEYAVRKATRATRGHVLWLTGGPGGNVLDFVPLVERFGMPKQTTDDYDYVYFNIRGVGENASAVSPVSCDASSAPDVCFQQIEQRGVPLKTITTRNFARDIDRLCDVLGCGQWQAIYGQSYGTRLIQEYVRLFPKRVRSVILDGVVSPNGKLFSDEGPRYKASLDQVFASCEQSPSCKGLKADPNAAWSALLESLLTAADQKKIVIDMKDLTGDEGQLVVSRSRIINFIGLLLRSTDERPYIARLIADSTKPQATYAMLKANLSSLILQPNVFGRTNDWVNIIVNCNEALRFDQVSDADLTAIKAQGGIFGDGGYAGTKALCQSVLSRIPEANADFVPEPVETDVHACVFNGSDDVVTPAQWAMDAASKMTRAQVQIFPYEGHVVLPSACGSELVKQCLVGPDRPIETGCVAALTSPYVFNVTPQTAAVTEVAEATSTPAEARARAERLVERVARSGDPSAISKLRALQTL